MVLNKGRILAVLLMVIVAGSVRAEEAKEVVIASTEELKGIKAKWHHPRWKHRAAC